MRKILSITYLTACLFAATAVNAQRYEPTWDSLKNYKSPEWYEDAKLGYWVHWGVYSVPAFMGDHAGEWYGRWMYCKEGQSSRDNQGLATHRHHTETYGEPAEFGYKDFIPMFKAENFDADEWADLCVRGGAKFFTMMGAHHDSFCLWDTKLSKWNSVNMGPKRDLVGEVEKAVRKRGLRFGVSNHTAWNYMFFQWNHINGYDAKDPALEDLYGNPIIAAGADRLRIGTDEDRRSWFKRSRGAVKPSQRDLDRWIERTNELATLYKPDLYYFDWGHKPKEFEPGKLEFGAHYYNLAVDSGMGRYGDPQVVLNHKNAYKPGTAIRDFERGGMNKISDVVWQTDDCVYDDHNWGYVPGVAIKPTNRVIDQLMDVISKRGVLMLSFAPMADGTFPEDQKKMMYELGDWLEVNAEAVYSTRPYEVFGEVGPKWLEKNYIGRKKMEATADDIRFTRNKANTVLYATLLEWPGKTALIKTLAGADLGGVKSVTLLGMDGELDWKQVDTGMEIQLPKQPGYGMAYPVRIEFNEQIVSPVK